MRIRKGGYKNTLAVKVVGGRQHALEEGAILEVNDLPAGNKLPRH